jgi:ketosteroid isomerase-like protein
MDPTNQSRQSTADTTAAGHSEQLRQSQDQAAVEAADNERIRATLAGDMGSLKALYAEDLIYVHASGVKDTRDSLMTKVRDGPTRYRDLRREETNVRIYGDTGVLNGRFAADVIMDGVERTFRASFMSIWIRSGPAWVMVSWQATLDMDL